MKGTKERYTVGIFAFPNGMKEPPKELVDDKHPLKFKPFDHSGLLQYYYYMDRARKGIESIVVHAHFLNPQLNGPPIINWA